MNDPLYCMTQLKIADSHSQKFFNEKARYVNPASASQPFDLARCSRNVLGSIHGSTVNWGPVGLSPSGGPFASEGALHFSK